MATGEDGRGSKVQSPGRVSAPRPENRGDASLADEGPTHRRQRVVRRRRLVTRLQPGPAARVGILAACHLPGRFRSRVAPSAREDAATAPVVPRARQETDTGRGPLRPA